MNSGPAGRLLAPDSSPKSPTPWRPETLPFRHLTHTPPLGLSSARAHPTSGETLTGSLRAACCLRPPLIPYLVQLTYSSDAQNGAQ